MTRGKKKVIQDLLDQRFQVWVVVQEVAMEFGLNQRLRFGTVHTNVRDITERLAQRLR